MPSPSLSASKRPILVFDVAVPTPTGRLCASVMVARQLLGDAQLRSWSDEELAFLFFVSSRVPRSYNLKAGITWAVCAQLLSDEQIADALRGATGVTHGRLATSAAIRAIRAGGSGESALVATNGSVASS